MLKLCAVIPVYNHEHAIGTVVDALRQQQLPIILVDDGSKPSCAEVLQQLATRDGVTLVKHVVNAGKGAAVISGLRCAAAMGFTHALQIDADGQHEPRDIPDFISASHLNPAAVINGYPIYDASVPKARLYGRYATHIWVWINTLSLRIKDSMCGFRIYPLAPTVAFLENNKIGLRMDFDTEILVRLDWEGVPVVNTPCHVRYPLDGVSHFQAVRDNVRISAMHTRLFFGMLRRLPSLLGRALFPKRRTVHWAGIGEVGFASGMRFLFFIYRTFGRWPFLLVLDPILAWYVLTHPVARRASMEYLARLHEYSGGETPRPRIITALRHFGAFAEMLLDKLLVWSGKPLPVDYVLEADSSSDAILASGRGAVIVTAHMGNPELFRLLARDHKNLRLNVLVHTRNAEQFNRLMREINPDSQHNLIQVTAISPATAVMLAERVAKGEHVVIAGDRIPIANNKDLIPVDFLGKQAYLPFGPYLLAGILKCPLIAAMSSIRSTGLHLTLATLTHEIRLPRQNRHAAAIPVAQKFADLLSKECRSAPLQWFNFFPFWTPPSP